MASREDGAKQNLQTLDLEAALSEYTANPAKREVLRRAITAHLDIAVIPDEELLEADTVRHSRITYVLSLLRLLAFIREPSDNSAHKEAQAKLSMAYIRHVESSNLAWLQFGRSAADESLMKEVQDLRTRMLTVTTAKAKLLKEAQDATPETPGEAHTTH